MTRCALPLLRLSALLAAVVPASAQRKPAPAAPRPAALSVQVLDSVTNRPMLRVALFYVRVDARTGARTVFHERADTTGQLALDSIPSGITQRFDVMCTVNASQAKHLDSLIVRLGPGTTRRWTVRASSQGCDQRPFTVRRGVFTGFWATRGESSTFTPCDSLLPEAWTEFRAGVLESPRAERPADLDETAPVFLRLQGTLLGPSYYGLEGRDAYLLTVDRILDLRAPAQKYCEEKG